jgi:hypothetical protein
MREKRFAERVPFVLTLFLQLELVFLASKYVGLSVAL